MTYVLWKRFMRHSPSNPHWFNRDRFVLSAGHGSMLLYSLLHLFGYDLTLDDVRAFRQWGSRTPGHPERGLTPGVETTTGPLGQGFANGIGMAIVEANLAAKYNRPGFDIVDHVTYGLVSDGDLMEGVASEAASLAGQLGLGKVVYLFDNNQITLAGSTGLTFSEDVAKRFSAYGWHTQSVEDGNDLLALDGAIKTAREELTRPSLIAVRTHIGYGSPHKQDTFEAHGAPLGADETLLTKQALNWPAEPPFFVPDRIADYARAAVGRGKELEAEWDQRFSEYRLAYPELAKELEERISGALRPGWDESLPTFQSDKKGIATRVAGGKVLSAVARKVPMLIGGSGDLDPSTHTALKDAGDFGPSAPGSGPLQGQAGGGTGYAGRNIHFGVREHAMAAIANGMAVHGGAIPYVATFLTFSDYMRPAIRLAALMNAKVIFIFTHDSIAMGEDGPTHQPVEHLASLRAIPQLTVIRPADANEAAEAWRTAIESVRGPTAMILSRQDLPVLDRSQCAPAQGLRRGGYVLRDPLEGPAELALVASGSEVHLVSDTAIVLADKGIRVRVVSMPSWELFDAQPLDYRSSVLPSSMACLAVEAGAAQGWHRYVGCHGDVLSVEGFGASAPGSTVMREYGFTVDNVSQRAMRLLAGQTKP
jgi:transketolase